MSAITELQKSVGQYLLYRSLLTKQEPSRRLFLAVSNDIYISLFCKTEIAEYLSELKINILIFNPDTEEIKRWID